MNNKIRIPVPLKALEFGGTICKNSYFTKTVEPMIITICRMWVTDFAYCPFASYKRINSSKLSKISGYHTFWRRLNPLIFNKVNYRSNYYSNGYRFKPEILTGGFKYVEINKFDLENQWKKESLRKRMEYGNKPRETDLIQELNYKPLSKLIKPKEAILELPKAIEFLKSLDYTNCSLDNKNLMNDLENRSKQEVKNLYKKIEIEGKITIKKIQLKQISKKQLEFKSFTIPSKDLQALQKLETGLLIERKKFQILKSSRKIFLNRDTTSNRLHNNLTNLPSEIIKYLKINKEKLVEIDMINCHYVFLSNILENKNFKLSPHFIQASKTLKSIHQKPTNTIGKKFFGGRLRRYLSSSSPQNFPLMFSGFVSSVDLPKDLRLFVNLSYSGKLYEYCMDYFGCNRSRVKLMFMEVVYGKYSHTGSGSVLFKKLFPTVYKVVYECKQYWHLNFSLLRDIDVFQGGYNSAISKGKSSYEGGNAMLPILLMGLESSVFVDGLLFSLWEWGFDAITKHDSVLVPQSQSEAVVRQINLMLIESLGKGCYKLRR